MRMKRKVRSRLYVHYRRREREERLGTKAHFRVSQVVCGFIKVQVRSESLRVG